ncbi:MULTISPECIES: thioredoxin family protein [unclassified Streptomyces]|uniref:thioredoxin family protein n=1 Tax=unclassified Streptomyces TaxID=2593676 RepID=UPI002E0E98E0|nr:MULTISPECIES: thioredoxin family protein [unclassified Streptomyces]WSR23913.1 thioredoxin family protein [Streptomyces sp. NBC_01205]
MLRPVRADLRTQPPRPGAPRGMRLPLVAAAVVAAGLTAACGPSTQPVGSAAPSAASLSPESLPSAASATESATASPEASPTASASVSASTTPRPGSSPTRTGAAAAGASTKPSRTDTAAKPVAVPGPGYDSSADAQKLIDAALRTAKSEGRMVLLDFGANWCGNCKAADKVFAQPQTAAILGNSYQLVKIDIGGNSSANSALLRKYSPSGGTYTMPVLVVVSPSGTVRTDTHVTGNPSLTAEGINSFLHQWAS